MNRSISQYRLITGIKSHQPNPIVINRSSHSASESARPEVIEHSFKGKEFDKDYAFNCTQYRWFQKRLHLGEEIIMTVDQLKMICDEVHEMGRLQERGY